ncbi:MAG: hypothetical protein DI616_07470 [Paracoccus denitrificans]|uniref:Uncharacterized protein n=1 Tax=Paracoccus denitrificans TaxID=266 RepID=A0A533IA21_PARDE|nr:MAG: hypothetical protein DI616_07470 [Paracoccus denitrificans]
MSLTLSQLMPASARAALLDERFEQYAVRAAVFLHQQLGWVVRDLDETALRRAISQSYTLSSAAGLRNEADHLKYLYAAGYWGIGFETDEQYAQPLREAGYRPADHGRLAYLPMEPVLNALERWQVPLQNEPHRPEATLHGLVQLAEAPAPNFERMLPFMASIWPERCQRLRSEQLIRTIENIRHDYGDQNVTRNAPAVYAAIALHLGRRLGNDPFLPWAAEAVTDGFALIHGLIDYWKSFGRAAA